MQQAALFRREKTVSVVLGLSARSARDIGVLCAID